MTRETAFQRVITVALIAFVVSLFVGLAEVHCEPVNVVKPAAIYLSLSAADLGSTEWAIRNGATEGNAFMQSNRAVKQLALAGAFVAADLTLQKRGHKRGAKVLRITYAAVRVAALAVNVRNARRSR